MPHCAFDDHTAAPSPAIRGFSLIQISALLVIVSLTMVLMLPGLHSIPLKNNVTATRLHAILLALRQYQAVTGTLPCPADASLPMENSSYGMPAANPGPTDNCNGGLPAANFIDPVNHVAMGAVPVRALQLPGEYALDGFGRSLTYAVDTQATGCWESKSLTGSILVDDNGIPTSTVVALVSHGADGFGAWVPRTGSSGAAVRLNSGSADTDQHVNAHLLAGGVFPNPAPTSHLNDAAGSSVTFVKKEPTATFDDLVLYRDQWNLNVLPVAASAYTLPTMQDAGADYPAAGNHTAGQELNFVLTYGSAISISGSPRLELGALDGGTIGTNNTAYATYQPDTSTPNILTFRYMLQPGDTAPNGLSLNAKVDLNGGAISGCTGFATPDLSAVTVSPTPRQN